jgi:hypothetical protein
VQKALQNNKWIAHIFPIQSHEELHEYVSLWTIVKQIQLVDGMEDSIVWRWTANGEYTTKSAYSIQFEGSFSKLRIMPIWKANAEPKCRFFAWTLMHKKILMANNLTKRHWSCDPTSKLCRIHPKTPTHLCKDCSFTKQVWTILKSGLGLSILDTVNPDGSLHSFWRKCRAKIDKAHKAKVRWNDDLFFVEYLEGEK